MVPTDDDFEPFHPGFNEDEPSMADLPKGVRQRIEAFIPELVRKTITAGMGAVFTTEEGIRRLTKEMPLPKEVAGYLVSTAASTKDELLRIIAREVREFLQNVNLSEEIARMLTLLSFEVKTEIRFIPNQDQSGGVEPNVRAKVRVKRAEDRRRRRARRGGRDRDRDGADDDGSAEAAEADPSADRGGEDR